MEVWYSPLSGIIMNYVLLDQVNCTEIDVNRAGFIHEVFDIGNIVLTFDRPTSQETFVLRDMKQTYQLGVYLTKKILDQNKAAQSKTIWLKDRKRQVAPTLGL